MIGRVFFSSIVFLWRVKNNKCNHQNDNCWWYCRSVIVLARLSFRLMHMCVKCCNSGSFVAMVHPSTHICCWCLCVSTRFVHNPEPYSYIWPNSNVSSSWLSVIISAQTATYFYTMNIVVDEHMGSLKLSLTYLKATILGYAHGWKNSGFVFTALEIKKKPSLA